MTDLWSLQRLDLFADLDPATIDQILRIVQVKHVRQGDFVFRPGDPSACLYLLQHGRVKTFVHSEQGQ